ncbi:MAG: GTP-binding protein, partial [bacterium]|nr:GTP-binding protein [bacterium]
MADGALLLIDAKEGPMPQTRFVLKHALELGLRIIVVINKIDKSDARIHHVHDKALDLFLELGADDETADFPVVYSSGKDGKAGLEADLSKMTDISPIFEAILTHIPPPSGDPTKPLQFLATTLSTDSHKGRIATGKIYNGSIQQNQEVMQINRDGQMKKYRLTSLMTFEGLDRISIERAIAGDIVALSGIPDITIGETVADVDEPIALPLLAIEQPTVRMAFSVNNSPFAGQEGEFKTSRQIRERVYKELETDMALRVEDMPEGSWMVSGRGELHLAILIERMRREGYELQASRPQVITTKVDGKTMTPYEKVLIEVPQDYSGIIMQKMGERHGELKDMTSDENNIVYLEFEIATKDLFGYRSEFLTDTRGLGIVNASFLEYRPDDGFVHQRNNGSLVAHESGMTNLYGLTNVQDRGMLFIGPGVPVYKGQVVGQNSREDDIRVNVCKTKQLSNMRSKGDGTMEHFNTPKTMGLEDALEYVSDDELVEVTPRNIRIRKRILDEVEARRMRVQGIR